VVGATGERVMNERRRSIGCCLFAAAISTSAALQAARLETVVVTASRTSADAIAVPKLVDVIDRATIDTSTAQHVTDLLRGRGGVQVSDLFGDGARARVDMRGYGDTSVDTTLILVDGRRLNNADSGAPDLNTVKLADVERIEIVHGSAATLYGDKAVGGVINIITRRPRGLRVQADFDAGSYSRRSLALAAENRHANGAGYRIAAERRLSENYRDNNDQQYSNLSGLLDFEHAGGRLYAEFAIVDENLDLPGALFRDQVAGNRRQAQNPGDFLETDTWSAHTGLVQSLPVGLSLELEYTNRKSDGDGIVSVGGSPFRQDLKRHHIELTPRLIGRWNWPHGTALVTLGGDWLQTDYRLVSDIGTTFDDQEQWGLYAQAILPILPQVDLTAGTRHAEVDNNLFVTLDFGAPLVTAPRGTEIDDDLTTWETGLTWRVNDAWRLYARAERSFRFPNADEFSSIVNFNAFPFPGPLPLPSTQTGRSYDLGVEWRVPGFEARLSGYRIDTDDEIAFEPFSFANFNIGDSRRYGLALQALWRPRERLELSAGYGFVDAELTSGAFDGDAVTFVARHAGRASAEYALTGHARAIVELTGASDRRLSGDFAGNLPALDGHVVAHARYTWEHDALAVSVRVNNLFDTHYSDAAASGFDFRTFEFPVPTYFPAPERNFTLSLRVRYD
jgi:iron complex outermembrane receptor protein